MHILGFKLKKCALLFILLLCTTVTTYADDFDANETYYLYNVGAKKYLYVGNNDGTMASLLYNDLGTPLHIDYNAGANEYQELDEDNNPLGNTIYSKIYTSIFNSGVNYFGFGDDEKFHLSLDDDSGNRWLMEKNGENGNIYTLRYYNKNRNQYCLLKAEHSGGTAESDKATNTKVGSETQDPVFVFTRTASDLTKDTIFYTTIEGIDRETECFPATDENGDTITSDNLDSFGHLTNLTGLSDQIGFTTDYEVPSGKYDFILTYIPTEDAKDIDIQLTSTEPERWDEEFDYSTEIVSPSDNGSDNTAKTVHLCINVPSVWTNLSVVLYSGDNSSVLPNIVSYSFSKAPDLPTDLDDYAKWQVVSKTELLNQLKDEQKFQNGQLYVYGGKGESKTDATLNEGNADVTFLMKDQGFTYGVDDVWNTNGASYTKDAIGNDPDNAMYWNAHITGKGQVYQDVDVPNVGVYQMDAYGFSHNCTTNMFYQYATKIDGNNITWSPVEATKAFTSSDKTYSGKQSDIDAGEAFYKESVLGENFTDYKRTLTFYVPLNAAKDADGNYKIRIGFDKTEQANDDYTAVDDVHLHYKGQSAFVLDGNWNENEMNAAISDIKSFGDESTDIHVPIYIKRNFWSGAWNPVVLPVAVTNAQIKQTFGDGAYISTPYGLISQGVFRVMRFTLLNGNDLQAGKYYLIYPGSLESGVSTLPYFQKETGDNATYSLDGKDDDGTEYFYLGTYNIKDVLGLSTAPGAMVKDTENGLGEKFHSKVADDGDEEVNLVGSYHNIEMTPKPYVFTNKNRLLYYTGNITELTAFKFYIYDVNPQAPLAKAAGFNAALSIGDGTTTGIDGVKVVDDGSRNINDGIIYNLSGERVGMSNNTNSLPAGIYIMNGKKFIKK